MKRHSSIRWAFVGLGKQADRMAEALVGAKGHEIVAIAGRDRGRREEFGKRFNVQEMHATLGSLLLKSDNSDAVCITSPNDEHMSQAISALRAGKNVLCEKPLALSMREGKAIMHAAERAGKLCQVNFHFRQHPLVQHARDLIAGGVVGTVRHIELKWSIGSFGEQQLPPLPPHMRWRESVKRAGGGALMARGVHLFDLVRFLTRKEITQALGFSDGTVRHVERTAAGILISGEVPVTFVTSKQIPAAQNEVVIYGSEARISLDIFGVDGGWMVIIDKNGTRSIRSKPQNLYTAVFDDFARAVHKQKTSNASVYDGIAATAITEAVIASARTKRFEKVEQSSRGKLRGSTNTRTRKAKRKA